MLLAIFGLLIGAVLLGVVVGTIVAVPVIIVRKTRERRARRAGQVDL